MTMRLTRRGWAVAGVAAGGTVLAALFGARALNAVVFPSVVALVAAVVQLYRLDEPTVERALPPAGFPDDERQVTLSFDVDATFVARVRDSLPPTLAGETSADVTVGAESVSYTVRYRRRGEHPVGPVTVAAHDVLGLAEREFVVGPTDYVLVYPRVHDLTPAARRDLLTVVDARESTARDEFDRLREYVRGDSLRDVHWKSSARQDDLVVKEFTADEQRNAVTVAAGGERGRGDEMAEAAASVVAALLRAGVPTTLVTPTGTVDVGVGDRTAVFAHLATASTGDVPDDDAAVVVHAGRRGTTVRVGEMQRRFDGLVAKRRTMRAPSGGSDSDGDGGGGDENDGGDESDGGDGGDTSGSESSGEKSEGDDTDAERSAAGEVRA